MRPGRDRLSRVDLIAVRPRISRSCPMPKIMVSSTSEDLAQHRLRVLDTLKRLKQDGVGMEFFGAEANTPVATCMQRVDEADLVILIVAHRYGWIPTVQEGGNGAHSITQMEFDRARNPPAGIK